MKNEFPTGWLGREASWARSAQADAKQHFTIGAAQVRPTSELGGGRGDFIGAQRWYSSKDNRRSGHA
jgi:hypothetical protein